MFGFGSKKIFNRFNDAAECMNYWIDLYNLPYYVYVEGNNKNDYCLKLTLEPMPNVHFKNEYRESLVKCTPLEDGMKEKVLFTAGNIDRFTLIVNDYKNDMEYINDCCAKFRDCCRVLNELI